MVIIPALIVLIVILIISWIATMSVFIPIGNSVIKYFKRVTQRDDNKEN